MLSSENPQGGQDARTKSQRNVTNITRFGISPFLARIDEGFAAISAEATRYSPRKSNG